MDAYLDWTKSCEDYKGQWVALADDCETVVGSGDTTEIASAATALRGATGAAITYVSTEVIASA